MDNSKPSLPARIARRYRYHLMWSAILTAVALAFTLTVLWFTDSWPWWLVWIVSISVVTGLAFSFDKLKAQRDSDRPLEQRGKGRIPELSLLWLSLIGGTVGALLAMLGRRHKTIDRRFMFRFGVVVALQALIIGFWISSRFFNGGE